jgi:hypothetical protein
VRPKSIANDIWRGSDPGLAAHAPLPPGGDLGRLPWYHPAWWALFIVSGLFERFANQHFLNAETRRQACRLQRRSCWSATPSTSSRPPSRSPSSTRRSSASACEHVFSLTTPLKAGTARSPNQQWHNSRQSQPRSSSRASPSARSEGARRSTEGVSRASTGSSLTSLPQGEPRASCAPPQTSAFGVLTRPYARIRGLRMNEPNADLACRRGGAGVGWYPPPRWRSTLA